MADPEMLFDIRVKDANLRQVVLDLFAQADRAVDIHELPEDVVTVHAADLGFRDALALILPAGYQAVERDGMFHIRRAA